MKSNVHDMVLSVLISAIDRLHDELDIPQHEKNLLSHDSERLACMIKSLGVWKTIQILSEADRLLIEVFRDGALPTLRPPLLAKKSKKDHRPKFLFSLWRLIVDVHGALLPPTDINYSAVLRLRQIFTCFKKLTKEFTDEQLVHSTQNFVRVDTAILQSDPVLSIGPDSGHGSLFDDSEFGEDSKGFPVFSPAFVSRREFSLFRYVAGIAISDLGLFDPYQVKPRHGPGVVADLRRGSYKYDFPTWHRRLEWIFPHDAFASHDLHPRQEVEERDLPSRMIAVPKDYKGPRLIAAEPTCNQWIQQAISGWLEERCKESRYLGSCIDLRDQTLSQESARLGSIDGSLATIDLSEASDRISYHLVKELFRSNPLVWEAMDACRTQFIEIPQLGVFHQLRKFSTMGSALTFPVQCVLFSCIAATAVLLSDEYFQRQEKPAPEMVRAAFGLVRVYGDDIIVPNGSAHSLCELLTGLGLKVNSGKSFWTGRFRESCGGDYLDGIDITPVKIKQFADTSNPESVISWISTCNNMLLKGFISFSSYLATAFLPQNVQQNIEMVEVGSGRFGLFSLEYDRLRPISRWNNRLHIQEVYVLAVNQRSKRSKTESTGPLLQYFTECPSPTKKWESGPRLRPTLSLKRRWVPMV